MKTKQIIYTVLILIFSVNLLSAQEKAELTSPKLDRKCNDLIIPLNAVIIFNSNYIRAHKLSFAEYGQFAAKQLIKNKLLSNITYNDFTKICLYPYSCFLKPSDYEIVDDNLLQSVAMKEKVVHDNRSVENMNKQVANFMKIRCCKPKGIIGDAEGYSYMTTQEYMEYFTSAMQTIGAHIGFNYHTEKENDIVYTIISEY